MTKPYYHDEWVTSYHGDCLDKLGGIAGNSVDLLLTDPPYGISFMGKDWDKALPDKKIWEECLRVLKPGAFAFVMSIPRSDCLSRMIISLEDAGFRTNFSPIYWAYASGFPKAQNIGKAVDKKNGRTQDTYKPFADYLKAQRKIKKLSMAQMDEVLGTNTAYSWWEGRLSGIQLPSKYYYLQLKDILDLDNRFDELIEREEAEREVISRQPMTIGIGGNSPRMGSEKVVDLPSTPQAKALDGSYGGFQPKPAVEVIIVCMKPLSEKTFVDQALKNQKGVTWLDDCRVPYESEGDKEGARFGTQMDIRGGNLKTPIGIKDKNVLSSQTGRFPANLLVSDDVLNDGNVSKSPKSYVRNASSASTGNSGMVGIGEESGKLSKNFGDSGSFSRYFDLDKWASTLPFLIVPKASKSEKNKGLDTPLIDRPGIYDDDNYEWQGEGHKIAKPTRNNHPTVKPLKLMSYLVTLGSRGGDIVLDPFMGSGSTLVAAKNLNRHCIGIELEEKYCEIAAKRCRQSVMELEITPEPVQESAKLAL